MSDEFTVLDSTLFEARVAEIGPPEGMQIDLPVPQVTMDSIRKRDENPEFVVIEIESGLSNNKRNWRPEILQRIATWVNESQPPAYRGHIPEKDDDHSLPPVQTLWVAAKAAINGTKGKLYLKGYQITDEIRRSVGVGAINSVSVRGRAALKPVKGGGYDVIDFKGESIDWSRKGRQGMTNRVLALTTEMQSETGGNTVEPKDIAALSEDDLRTNNPLLVKKIEDDAKASVQGNVKEMEEKAQTGDAAVDTVDSLRKKLGLKENDDPVAAVTELLATVTDASKAKIRDFVRSIIAKKVKGENAQNLVLRLVGEQETFEDYAEKMENSELPESAQKEIETKIEEMIEKDTGVKAIISEMSGEESSRGGSHVGGARPAHRLSEGGKSGQGEDGVISSNERMTVRTRTL